MRSPSSRRGCTLPFDGVKVDDQLASSAGIFTDQAASLRIACRSDGTHLWDGVIEDVRIYKRALSDDEILELARR
jgi:hypothetical protein